MTTSPRPDTPALDELRLRLLVGAPVGPTSDLPPRLRRAVTVAQRFGAPLLAVVDAAGAAEDDLAAANRAVAVATAQTRTVAIGLVGAPLLLVPALSRLVGADLIGFLTSRIGLLVLAVGGGLLLTGAVIIWWLVRRVGRVPARAGRSHTAVLVGALVGLLVWRVLGPILAPVAGLVTAHLAERWTAAPSTWVPGLEEAVDLTATALQGGCSVTEALRTTAELLPELAPALHRLAFELELGIEPEREFVAPLGRLGELLRAADRLGAPVADSLRRLARELRADDHARVLAAAERLPAQLTFPTALCLLPGTVVLIGAPIVHAGLAGLGT